jgi:AcrR family transcriptional regulator
MRMRRTRTPVGGGEGPHGDPLEDSSLTETQRRILAAALELFSENGFHASATAEIAHRAGVAEKTLFANFKSKRQLFLQTLSPAALQLIGPDFLLRLQETLDTPWSRLDEFIRSIMVNRIEFARAHPAKLKLILQELLLQPELSVSFAHVARRDVLPRVKQVLDRFRAEGQLRDVPLPAVLSVLVYVTLGYAVGRFILGLGGPSGDDPAQDVDAIVDLLVNGMRTRPEAAAGEINRRARTPPRRPR